MYNRKLNDFDSIEKKYDRKHYGWLIAGILSGALWIYGLGTTFSDLEKGADHPANQGMNGWQYVECALVGALGISVSRRKMDKTGKDRDREWGSLEKRLKQEVRP